MQKEINCFNCNLVTTVEYLTGAEEGGYRCECGTYVRFNTDRGIAKDSRYRNSFTVTRHYSQGNWFSNLPVRYRIEGPVDALQFPGLYYSADYSVTLWGAKRKIRRAKKRIARNIPVDKVVYED